MCLPPPPGPLPPLPSLSQVPVFWVLLTLFSTYFVFMWKWLRSSTSAEVRRNTTWWFSWGIALFYVFLGSMYLITPVWEKALNSWYNSVLEQPNPSCRVSELSKTWEQATTLILALRVAGLICAMIGGFCFMIAGKRRRESHI